MIRKRVSLLRTITKDVRNLWSCQNVCDALSVSFWIIFILWFGTKLYRHFVGIPVGTNCALLVADLFLFCYERDFMISLSNDNQADIIKAFNSTSRYLDDLLNIDNHYFEGMVNQIYPPELRLNKANTLRYRGPLSLFLMALFHPKNYDKCGDFDFDIVNVPFLDVDIPRCPSYPSKIYDKHYDFDFDIVNFPFLDGDVPRRPSYGVYISQLMKICSSM